MSQSSKAGRIFSSCLMGLILALSCDRLHHIEIIALTLRLQATVNPTKKRKTHLFNNLTIQNVNIQYHENQQLTTW